MKKIILLCGLLVFTHCTPQLLSPVSQNVPGKFLQSSVSRAQTASIDTSDIKIIQKAQSAFAFDLYQKLAEKDGNLFFSPFSISSAMGMLYAGARGDTEKQLASGMHFELTQDLFHQAMNTINQDLDTRDDGAFRLNIDNNIWVQETYPIQTSYLDVLMQSYGSGVYAVDFVTQPDDTRNAINNWIEGKTQKRIQELLPAGSVDSSTALILTNSIYFKARWAEEFYLTEQKDFHLQDNQTKSIEMMGIRDRFKYASGQHYEMIEIPYDENSATMIILVPAQGHFSDFQNPSEFFMADHLNFKEVILWMPKFSFKTSFGVISALQSFGIQDAFNPEKADFSGIDGTRELYVSGVLHQAFIKVDEQGTEAAAATATTLSVTAAPALPVEPTLLIIDRPFIFTIRDNKTGMILFIGHVLDVE